MSLKAASEHEVIREKFDAHKDGQDGSELRNKYEVPHFFFRTLQNRLPYSLCSGSVPEEYSIRDLEFAIQEAEAGSCNRI